MLNDRIKLNQESRLYVKGQFETIILPKFFIVIQWCPFALSYQTAVSNSRHFKNVLLCQLYNCRLKELPADRCKTAWFQEKVEVDINPQQPRRPKYRFAYHSNLHLGRLPEKYQNSHNLSLLIARNVSPRCERLSKASSKINKGVVIKEWNAEYHMLYNLKDLSRYHHELDGDLVIDYENSDFAVHHKMTLV
jgi:hypothetical protein